MWSALEGGYLRQRPCAVCGAARADAHHDDYSKPMDVRWLCRTHHLEWHSENGEAMNATLPGPDFKMHQPWVTIEDYTCAVSSIASGASSQPEDFWRRAHLMFRSASRLAEFLGVSQRAAESWVRGERRPRPRDDTAHRRPVVELAQVMLSWARSP